MINVADCYYLDELGQEMFKNNKYEECSILLMASCFREHVHIQDCLYKFNKYIYDIPVTSLPLTPKEFMCIDDIIKWLINMKSAQYY